MGAGDAAPTRVTTGSPAGTRRLAGRLGRACEPGDVIALVGELGAGKTTFITGLATGLGVPAGTRVMSPTFTLINEYAGRMPLYHIDFYRLEGRADLEELGLDEYLAGGGVCAIEWFDRFPVVRETDFVEARLTMQGRSRRQITLIPHGPRAAAWLRALPPSRGGRRAAGPRLAARSCLGAFAPHAGTRRRRAKGECR
jgi:tRNA threonylcarbamoyladenosine biosynthesis protein TsaE